MHPKKHSVCVSESAFAFDGDSELHLHQDTVTLRETSAVRSHKRPLSDQFLNINLCPLHAVKASENKFKSFQVLLLLPLSLLHP